MSGPFSPATLGPWKRGCFFLAAAALALAGPVANAAPRDAAPGDAAARARLFVLTDVGADPDDEQSLIRLLLYSNDIEIEGLAATTSKFLPDRVEPAVMEKLITAYEAARPNLIRHDRRYPSAKALRAIVSSGPAQYGMASVGPGLSSPAAEALIRALERADDRPLWVSIWGGPNVLAQALSLIRERKTPQEAERLYARLRVQAISDQDDSGPWIRSQFPSVWYLVSPSPANATWRAMSNAFEGTNQEVVSPEWIASNIQQGHGPLGAAYPDTAYGTEGDTPAFLNLIPNGLNTPERPDWGGWGGRYELYVPELGPVAKGAAAQIDFRIRETRPIWTNAVDRYPPPQPGRHPVVKGPAVEDNYVTLWRWREDVQRDFAGRMAWATRAPAEANHPPLAHAAGGDVIEVRSGESFALDARGSSDPDGDSLSYFWFQYPEAGSFKDVVSFGSRAHNLQYIPDMVAPTVEAPATIHFILRVTDKGTPPLTSYRRVIVRVVPR